MKKNLMTIDLDKLEASEGLIMTAWTMEGIKNAQVPTPCTLTDAVEKYGNVQMPEIPNDIDGNYVSLECKKEVENFKENHLYKEDVLEDGLYIDDGVYYRVINGKILLLIAKEYGIKKLKNPRKIAEL
jgi:hypothetical protein